MEIQFEISGKHEIVQSYAKKRPVKRKTQYSLAKEKNAKNFLYEVLFRRFCPGYKFSKVIINSAVYNDKYSTSESAIVTKFFFKIREFP